MKIEKGIKDIREVIPDLNKIFHKKFQKLMPKIYGNQEYIGDHYICYDDDGNRAGILASLPVDFRTQEGTVLQARGVGMVGVLKSARGKGVMDLMMKRAVADAEKDGIDFMYLSGKRNRYQRYGFTPAGTAIDFYFNEHNFKYYKPVKTYTFQKIKSNPAVLPEIEKLYSQKQAGYARKHFAAAFGAKNYHGRYAIIENGQSVGYFITFFGKIKEFYAAGADILDVLCSLQKEKKRIKHITLYADDLENIRKLYRYAENFTIYTSNSLLITNYKTVLQALLTESERDCRNSYSVVLQIGTDAPLQITCERGAVTVTETAEPAEIQLPKAEATGILLNPYLCRLYGLPFFLYNIYVTLADKV